MPLSDEITKRFRELAEQGMQVLIKQDQVGIKSVDDESFHQWASSAMHLVAAVFGEDSPHYRNLSKAYDSYLGYPSALATMRGIFIAAKSDYDGGYLFRIDAILSGEIFGDFVIVAKAALAEGQKDVAAVMACAALEDALKRFGRLKGIVVEGKSMQDVINALKAKGLVSGPQKSLLDSMPRIRDSAMHADWAKITPQDVGSVIGFVEQFLLTQFH